jgi:hypothetical protein
VGWAGAAELLGKAIRSSPPGVDGGALDCARRKLFRTAEDLRSARGRTERGVGPPDGGSDLLNVSIIIQGERRQTHEGLNKRLGVSGCLIGEDEPSGNAKGELAIKYRCKFMRSRI